MAKNDFIADKTNSFTVKLISHSKKLPDKYIKYTSFFFILSSLIVTFYTKDTNWFSASGGVNVAIGLLIFSELIIPTDNKKTQYEINNVVKKISSHKQEKLEGPEFLKESWNAVTTLINNRWRYITALEVTFIGTVVWSYGFILNYLPYFNCSQ